MRITFAACIVCGAVAIAAEPAAPRDAAYWLKLADTGMEVPEGENPGAMLVEASAFLASPDPKLRDGVAYGVAADWILKKKVVRPPELRSLLALWTPNLKKGVGTSGSDGVLLRSFSALDLSLVAARDVTAPYLEPAELKSLLDAALSYLAAERDLRGYDAAKGWVHATAHTADLLKFLARNPRVTAADAGRILAGIGAKVLGAGEVFAWGEDERLASAVLAVLRRGDLDPAVWNGWLEELAASSKGLWDAPTLDAKQFAAMQNAKHVLSRLHVLLYALPDAPPKLVEARGQVLGALERMP